MNNVYPFADRETIEAEARQWLIRLDGDAPVSPEDIAALREWSDRSPAHRAELQRISAFWNDANILTELAIPLNNQIDTNVHSGVFSRLSTWLSPFKGTGIVLAGLLGIAVAVSIWLYPSSQGVGNGIYGTTIGELQVKTLADGSIVHINTDSQVQVEYSDTTRKIRLLRGEAYFAVAKDLERPFEVYAGKNMVQAVGTAFSVHLRNHDVKVIVTEGKVDLATQADLPQDPARAMPGAPVGNGRGGEIQQHKLIRVGSLSRGQSAVYGHSDIDDAQATNGRDAADIALNIEVIAEEDQRKQLAWRDGYLVFDGDSLQEVIAEVSRYTPITIKIADPALGQIQIGGRFKVGDMEALYEALEVSFGIDVNHLDDQHVRLAPSHG